MTTLTADMAGPSNAALATAIANVDPDTVQRYYAETSVTKVWDNAAQVSAVRGAIIWNRFTPADAVPTDTALNVAIWQARSLSCQGKQFNLQLMLTGGRPEEGLPAHLQGFRDGVKDACASIPSSTGGANQNGGWTTAGTPVQAALQRFGTRLEVLFGTVADGQIVSTRYNYGLSRDEAIAAIRVLNPA
jgi:hypothetical protein